MTNLKRGRRVAPVLKTFFVYILASKRNGTLYIGLTNDLARRAYEHKNKVHKGFTRAYNVQMLVYYEVFEDIDGAIVREKQLKKWNRQWKLQLIEKHNPKWEDLHNEDGLIRELPRYCKQNGVIPECFNRESRTELHVCPWPTQFMIWIPS